MIDIDNIDIEKFEIGKVSGICGKAAYDYIERAISLAMNKKVAAVVTPPINKEALNLEVLILLVILKFLEISQILQIH